MRRISRWICTALVLAAAGLVGPAVAAPIDIRIPMTNPNRAGGPESGVATIKAVDDGVDQLSVSVSGLKPSFPYSVYAAQSPAIGTLPVQFLGQLTTDDLGNGSFVAVAEIVNAYAPFSPATALDTGLAGPASGALANAAFNVPLDFIRIYEAAADPTFVINGVLGSVFSADGVSAGGRHVLSTTAPISDVRIQVIAGTYGANCQASDGNVTADLAAACDGMRTCAYTVDVLRLGDPAPGCAKSYRADYACVTSAQRNVVRADAEAGFGSVVQLACSSGTIAIESATYGGACGAPPGNVTSDLAATCNGTTACTYRVDSRILGDPAPDCRKAYVASYFCGGTSPLARSASAPAEAGRGSVVTLTCQ